MTDLKNMIEWARANGNCTAKEFELIVDLADIGLKSVLFRKADLDAKVDPRMYMEWRSGYQDATDAFLAKHGGGA